MGFKRLLGLGSKRLRALTILAAAGKALRKGRPLRGAGLMVVAALAWKYFLVAMVAEALLGALRGDDSKDDPDAPSSEPET
ncbi:hypothetical protein [Halalkalicoccus sp. NIPERK01]|uniref:hypothetical protein n=1 Tax=Halalkalicoccus sp. NIPERK01 TaxID=3053469 RepID=UPI00256F1FCA|nr:hypothetical protein [Halalkalicoccus sp. NIPERK01]MDL5363640.1 hypothetical protein [Halalkalicoccus sp. NIPERK01]